MTKKVSEAGGIVVRLDGWTPQILLVKAKKNPNHWVFPKGHIEAGESRDEAALREVREEAGVLGQVLEQVGAIEFCHEGNVIYVDFFLMKFVGRVGGGEQREARWCTLEEANELLTFEDTRRILRAAVPLIQERLDLLRD